MAHARIKSDGDLSGSRRPTHTAVGWLSPTRVASPAANHSSLTPGWMTTVGKPALTTPGCCAAYVDGATRTSAKRSTWCGGGTSGSSITRAVTPAEAASTPRQA